MEKHRKRGNGKASTGVDIDLDHLLKVRHKEVLEKLERKRKFGTIGKQTYIAAVTEAGIQYHTIREQMKSSPLTRPYM